MAYTTVLPHWDRKSALRSKPRRLLTEDEGLFFSPDLTPPAAHPLVAARGPEAVAELLTRRLYSYLDFTTVLEQEIVNPVVLGLCRDTYGLDLPEQMRLDAYRIYCDEAYHALFSVDVKLQVEHASGTSPQPLVVPRFETVILRARQSLPAEARALADLCAAVVSETLISSTLTEVPADGRVVRVVRETFADHAADERTHHAYFARVIKLMWPRLDKSTRRLLGPCFADFILAFLCPDLDAYQEMLRVSGFGPQQTRLILAESFTPDDAVASARHAARSTIALLDEVGVFADARTRDHFQAVGLIHRPEASGV